MPDCKVPAESDGEPVDDLNNRDKADSKAETAEPSKTRDEVEPCHLGGALELCKIKKSFVYTSLREDKMPYQTLLSRQRRD